MNEPIPLSVRPRKVPLPKPLTVRNPAALTERPAPVKLTIELEPTFMRAMVVEARVDEARVAEVRRAWPKSCVVPVTPRVLEAFNAPLKRPVVPVIAPRLALDENKAVAVRAVEEALLSVAKVATFKLVTDDEPEKNVVADRIEVEALPKVARPVTFIVDAKLAAPVCALVPEIVVLPEAVVKPGATNVVPSKVKVVDVASEFVAFV